VRLAKSDPLMFGSSLAGVFSAPAYDCRVLGPEQKPEFAVTRLRSGPREMEKATQYPADNAILICVALRFGLSRVHFALLGWLPGENCLRPKT
jgi:hypothetical protein